jgi:hypothetical protein
MSIMNCVKYATIFANGKVFKTARLYFQTNYRISYI